jgi:hypothetical protein
VKYCASKSYFYDVTSGICILNSNCFRVWGEPVDALDCGPKPKAWICKFLGREDVSFVYADPRLPKRDMTIPKKSFDNLSRKGDEVQLIL